ncbi:MAG: TolC family protein, partial [Pyrinomonadaceae bacterium]
APPGTTLAPQTQTTTPVPAQQPATTTPAGAPRTDATTTTTREGVRDPSFPVMQPRPVPPLPTLSRVGVTSGDTLALTLNEAIRRALENNNDIEVARNDVRIAETFLRSLQGAYDPVLVFSPQINNSVSPQQSSLGGADESGTVTTTDFSFSPSITKRFEFAGGSYEAFFNNNRRTTSGTFSLFSPVYSSSLGVSFTQPLWRDREIDNTRRLIRVQRKRLEQSDADFRLRTIDVIARVQRAYWDLVFSLRDEQNQIANVNLARENFRRTEASVAAGATAPVERAEIQTELSNREAALLIANQNVTLAENNLKNLMLRDPLAPEWSRAIVPTDQPSVEVAPVSLPSAIEEARANRPELRRLRIQQEVSDIDLKYFRNQTKPRVDLQGTFSTTGLAGTPIGTTLPPGTQAPLIIGDPLTNSGAFLLAQVNQLRAAQGLPPATVPNVDVVGRGAASGLIGGYGRNLSNLFSLDTRNIVVGVTIQIPLRNRTAEANLAQALIEREQLAANTRSQEQLVELEVRNAVQAVETARRRVLAARQARESAEQQLEGERRLFQVGRSTTFLLFQRENALVNARNQELRAETDYNKALAELQRATSTTLRANNVIVETPTLP